MRNLLQILLIIFALALSALVAFQWHRETGLRQQVQSLTDELQKHRATASTFSNSVNHLDTEILRLRGLTNQFNEAAKSYQAEIDRLKTGLDSRTPSSEQVDGYQKALDIANGRIAKQNEDLKKLAADHNNAVLQFNKLTEDYNELVKRWNAQQEQLGKTVPPSAPDK